MALLLTCVVIVGYDLLLFREGLTQELSTQADIIGANSTTALLSGDRSAARTTLQALRFQPAIIKAVIYDKNGIAFATYSREQEGSPLSSSLEEESSGLSFLSFTFVREIVLEGGRIGTIYLQSDLETLYSRWTGFVGIVAGVLFAAGLLAFILSSRLQQIISEPILRLTTLARRVSAEKNYSLREVKTSQDEIGTLIDDFNDMLEQIQLRDRQLEQSREHLEDLVAKRTSELEGLRSRLELILDTVGEGVYGVDANGLTTFLNDAASSMIGWTPEELLGKPLHTILHHTKPDGSPYPREDCPILATARDGTVHHVDDESFWRKDGTSFSVEYVSAPMRDKQRGLVGAVVTFRDITERKRAEKALKKAKQAAESANLAKSQFLANMSHEIRTPMNGVLGMADLLINTDLTSRQNKFVESLLRSGQALLQILNNILDFSKVEAGKLDLEIIDFNLRQTIEDTVELFAESAQHKDLELVCQISPDVPTFTQGDPGRLRQILTNLIGNAIKFTAHGEVVLRTTVHAENSDGALVRFEITDTGVGIAPEALTQIFEAFAQADSSTTRKFGGTGLGLAIAKQLVELMGGSISVASKLGKGSTFRVTAPLHHAKSAPIFEPEPNPLRGLSVLIGDGNASTRASLEEQASAWGMFPSSVPNGSETWAQLQVAAERGQPFDIAILDREMPGMDNLQLVRRIKESSELSATRVVLLTPVHFSETQEKEARQFGIQGFLSKPIRQAELYNCLIGTIRGSSETFCSPSFRSSPKPDAPTEPWAHLLLAEDNPVNQELVQAMGEHLNLRVDVAGDGHEALEALSRTSYDLVLMDWQMPELDGLETTREIRRREALGVRSEAETSEELRVKSEAKEKAISDTLHSSPVTLHRIPIIALTANAIAEDGEKCLAAGMDDFLIKPFSIDQFQAILERWLPKPVRKSSQSQDHSGKPEPPPLTNHPTLSPPGESPIDQTALNHIRALQRPHAPNVLDRVLTQYLTNTPQLLEALQQAAEQGDPELLKRTAHSLKSSSANVGAYRLADRCKELETFAHTHNPQETGTLLAAITTEYQSVGSALAGEFQGALP